MVLRVLISRSGRAEHSDTDEFWLTRLDEAAIKAAPDVVPANSENGEVISVGRWYRRLFELS